MREPRHTVGDGQEPIAGGCGDLVVAVGRAVSSRRSKAKAEAPTFLSAGAGDFPVASSCLRKMTWKIEWPGNTGLESPVHPQARMPAPRRRRSAPYPPEPNESHQIQVNRGKSSLSTACQFVILASPRGISGSILRFCARQPLRHARGSLRRTRPTNCILPSPNKVTVGHGRSHL
jgi:hypothetical protein